MARWAKNSYSAAAFSVFRVTNRAVARVGPSGANKAFRRTLCACNAVRAASCQTASCKASRATAREGPATAHGPRRSASCWRICADAKMKPTRIPARPKNLPSERSTIRFGAVAVPASDARLSSGVGSMKASSTISQPPRAASSSAAASKAGRDCGCAVGLFGLHSRTYGVAASKARLSGASRSRRRRCPARCQACGCSLYTGPRQATLARGSNAGKV